MVCKKDPDCASPSVGTEVTATSPRAQTTKSHVPTRPKTLAILPPLRSHIDPGTQSHIDSGTEQLIQKVSQRHSPALHSLQGYHSDRRWSIRRTRTLHCHCSTLINDRPSAGMHEPPAMACCRANTHLPQLSHSWHRLAAFRPAPISNGAH